MQGFYHAARRVREKLSSRLVAFESGLRTRQVGFKKIAGQVRLLEKPHENLDIGTFSLRSRAVASSWFRFLYCETASLYCGRRTVFKGEERVDPVEMGQQHFLRMNWRAIHITG